MSNIRELNLSEIAFVSGGNANSGYEGSNSNIHSKTGPQNSLSRNAPTHIYSDPSTVRCANQAFGALTSLPNIGRASAKMVGAATECLNTNSSGRGQAAGSAHCSGDSVSGTCNR
ncbi:hypothetical protein [Pantoea agglomerans]|uniref:hypothetical protein n=1 Tax=Enterobacter agglomerans TaxID=549 RepID=UPI003C7E4FC7